MALDDGSPQLELERVDRPPNSGLPAVLISVAAIFVVLALIKPWPAPAETTDTSNHPIQTTLAQTPQPTAVTGESGFFQQCFPTDNWRLTAIQDHGTTAVRTVWPAAPQFVAADASGTESVRVFGPNVAGIGFCAPGQQHATRLAQAAAVSLWRRDATGAIVPVAGARVIDSALASEGEVYLAPPTPLGANGEWPVGDYFFEISRDRTGSNPTWLALRVMPEQPAAAPTTKPTATPQPGA
ncbi:MAG: hypothetical protein QFC55_00090 [Chloroflexota bacterium]|nr:hypothetical protein [Chloroflexota bacterium]